MEWKKTEQQGRKKWRSGLFTGGRRKEEEEEEKKRKERGKGEKRSRAAYVTFK